MAFITTTSLTTPLQSIMQAEALEPGSEPSYQLCKTIYTHHPLGLKMAESPVSMAQSQPREITIQDGPKQRLVEAFEQEWADISADDVIFEHRVLSRVYGVATLAVHIDGEDAAEPMGDLRTLWKKDISFHVFDPLNTSGSLVLNQQPNDRGFLRASGVTVQGQDYHPSRCIVLMNERPVYLSYTSAAFGYVGRSVYQRALYPLKSYLQSMVTDDMVVRKVGLLVAKLKQTGSIVTGPMQRFFGRKRELLKEAETGNVLSIGNDETIESLNLQNLEGPYTVVRKNILENIASSADMPAMLLNQESFAEGFADGSEDAKHVARFVDRERMRMGPSYAFMDRIVMHRAWNPEFYAAVQNEFPDEYSDVSYDEAFNRWRNSFKAIWPNLLTEPDSEKSKADDVKLQAVVKLLEAVMPHVDPSNKAILLQWAADNFNELEMLFGSTLELDYEAIAEHAEAMVQAARDAQAAGFASIAAGDDAADADAAAPKHDPAEA